MLFHIRFSIFNTVSNPMGRNCPWSTIMSKQDDNFIEFGTSSFLFLQLWRACAVERKVKCWAVRMLTQMVGGALTKPMRQYD